MAFLAFSGAEALGIGGGLAAGSVLHSSGIDLSYHGFGYDSSHFSTGTETPHVNIPPIRPPPPHVDTPEFGYVPPKEPHPQPSDPSDLFNHEFHNHLNEAVPTRIINNGKALPPLKVTPVKPYVPPPPKIIIPPTQTSFGMVGNSHAFGAGLQTEMTLNLKGQDVISAIGVTVGGPYAHPQITSGGISVTVPIR